jgi:uroporphyrinogen-III decarboxylase
MATFTDPDRGKTPEQLFAERSQRVSAALQLKQPDRIPIQLPAGYLLAEMGGVSRQELQDNLDKQQELLEQAALRFQPDSIMGLYNNPRASVIVGDRMTRWPGYGLPANGSFQFVEGEYMKPEDYDAFLEDPADWSLRKYWPRVFPELAGLAMLPPLGIAAYGAYALPNLGILTAPPVVKAFEALSRAAQAQAEVDACLVQSTQRMIALGFAVPTFVGSITEAPFDFMSDTLRGMRGIMLDIHRRPDKLLAAQEKVLKFQLEYAINWSRATGINVCFIPLHRGSDGFMSLPQFETFYWPQLKALQVGLVEAGIMPFVFYEGNWNQRLHYLTELPRGKTAGLFQLSDIFKVKEIVGDTMCIVGGMPNSMLQAGTPDQVRSHTKKLCEVVGKGGGYIMSNGIGELEGSRPELIDVWVEATKEYGVY